MYQDCYVTVKVHKSPPFESHQPQPAAVPPTCPRPAPPPDLAGRRGRGRRRRRGCPRPRRHTLDRPGQRPAARSPQGPGRSWPWIPRRCTSSTRSPARPSDGVRRLAGFGSAGHLPAGPGRPLAGRVLGLVRIWRSAGQRAAGSAVMAGDKEFLPRLDLGRVAVDRVGGPAAGVLRGQVVAVAGLDGVPALAHRDQGELLPRLQLRGV